jgi:hypothetical protein
MLPDLRYGTGHGWWELVQVDGLAWELLYTGPQRDIVTLSRQVIHVGHNGLCDDKQLYLRDNVSLYP